MENAENYEIDQDLRQSREYGLYMERIGWKSELIQHSGSKIQVFLKKLGPLGIVKIQRTRGVLPLEKIEKYLKDNGAMLCKIEPSVIKATSEQSLKSHGYKMSKWPLLGTKTLRVNLKPENEDIFNSLKKDSRYILRKIYNLKHETKINDFDGFYEIWKKSAKRKDLWIPGKKEYQALIDSFGEGCLCLNIDNSAGCLVLIHMNTAFYYYAGSTAEAVKNNLPYLVVWEAIKEAKKRGCTVWDFEGIYDSRFPNKGWMGFSHFKKSFGGQEMEFPGSWEKWRWPF